MRILPSYRDVTVALSPGLRSSLVGPPLLCASAALFSWTCAHGVGGRHAQASSAPLTVPPGSSSDAAEVGRGPPNCECVVRARAGFQGPRGMSASQGAADDMQRYVLFRVH